ncbi:MAG TPA: polyprenyl diphosphate synthase [Gammaproteobacteria bacterium]|nr:polyprenyl diphosphate synthase [Gammaproteobacteria bacterium]
MTSQSGEVDPSASVPRHVAIIMDGNGRWAKARRRPRHYGHRAGARSVRTTVETCARAGVEALTLFAFSSENWQRPASEVSALMELFLRALDRETERLYENNVRLRLIGDRSRFSDKLKERMATSEALTADNTGLQLVIAAGYGGRWDIAGAARRLAAEAVAGKRTVESIDERAIGDAVCLADLPEPDLFIRTGGEVRISNFLIWQLAYTELYFTNTLWPEFDADAANAALRWFAERERRFGRTSEQVAQPRSQHA